MSTRIALVRPLAVGAQSEFQEPMGAQAICGYLRRLGWECRVFDRQLDRRMGRDTLAELRSYDPQWVGFSLLTQEESADALQLFQMLKQPSRFFWAGGLFVTTTTERARAMFPVDVALICGEGERAVAAFLRGEELPKELLSPDEWANPSRDDLKHYLRFGGVINLRSARGCPGRCVFCATPSLYQSRYCARSVRLVAEEMKELTSRHEAVFNFVDDDFGPLERIEELAEELDRRKVRAAYSLELRAGELIRADEKQLAHLHAAGLCRVFVGLENLDRETLRRWRKPIDPDALLAAVRRCRSAGIEPAVGYILWHERSTLESVREQMETLNRYSLLNPKTALSRLVSFPGSELYRERGNYGTAQPIELMPSAAMAYRQTERLIGPLYRLWVRAAALLPGVCCRDHLYNRQDARALHAVLTKMDEQCYGSITSQSEPDLTAIAEELDAFCSARHASR